MAIFFARSSILLALLLSACSSEQAPRVNAEPNGDQSPGSSAAMSGGSADPGEAISELPSREEWHLAMQKIPLPGTGCFRALFPANSWEEVPCEVAPQRPYGGPRIAAKGGPQNVGNGIDTVAVVPGLISSSIGSFPVVTGVTSETSAGISDNFSLQLNSSFFPSAACSGAANPSSCLGWQQFVFDSMGQLFMQYWLCSVSG